ncbi:hypothetical protein PLESTB_000734000 [Pleodorina starrii]|uniref:Cytochrome P450 n=1 Tax=Pleodorina starrii TaxID=330485 RepID=A0A9W6BJI2_9CHLO|nr:hypothetical protein PLESTB_000734000 [Pleodorina starrii]GLC67188.1 hypothetical protein PLESTF_000527200 [Pleodorina starrii]
MFEAITAVVFGLGKALCVLALVLLLLGLDIGKRWRLRHIPGPPALPFLGNLPQLLTLGSPTFFRQCRKKYGPVFRVAFGRNWSIVVAEPDLLRQVGTRVLNHALFRSLMRGEFQQLDDLGLLIARDDYWRLVRSAWQPAFSAASLSGYLPRMVACAVQLTDRLETRAREAEAEAAKGGSGKAATAAGRVNIHRELGSMTLQVVGSTAYGVDFRAMDCDDIAGAVAEVDDAAAAATAVAAAAAEGGSGRPDDKFGRVLVEACRNVFRYSSLVYGTKYSRVSLLLPELRPLVSAVAHVLPDRPFAQLLRARGDLRNACVCLIQGWKTRPVQPLGSHPGADTPIAATTTTTTTQSSPRLDDGNKPPLPASSAAANGRDGQNAAVEAATFANGFNGNGNGDGKPSGSFGKGAAAEGAESGAGPEAAPRVAVGSFLGLILSARDKASGAALTDLQVAAQVQTFILAGYETTANGLAFAVYCIATNPKVERRLLAEIDEVLGPDRPPTEADLPRLPYTEAVFNEALRLYPPAHATNRLEDKGPVQVGGYTVPANTAIFLSIYSAHHNPDVWPRAEEFIPERFLPTSPLYPEVCSRVPNAHAPFGYGSRMCIGWKFAVQEAKVALARLYQRLVFELEPGQVPLRTSVGITLAPKDGLWVRPVARHPLPASPAAASAAHT